MLTEMDKKLIAKEEKRFDHIEKLVPLLDSSNPIKSIEDLFEQYEIQETTQHWYDSEPKDETGHSICEKCEMSSNPKCYKDCNTWNKWEKSEQQLSFNNWIDVWGLGMWDATQDNANQMVKEIFETEILKDKEFEKRLFWYQPPADRNIFYLF